MRRILLLISIFFVVATANAQEPIARGPVLLIAGVDVNGEGFPLVVVDVGTGDTRTLATFARGALCPPSLLPQARAVIYEVAGPTNTVYQVNTSSGDRVTLREPDSLPLNCPQISPSGDAIAWINPANDGTQLLLSDITGNNVNNLVSHDRIYDVIWSPAGSLLVYTVMSDSRPYPELYSMSRNADVAPYLFWTPEMGLVLDYEWAGNGAGLLVAYTVDGMAGVTLFPIECVVGVEEDCVVDPIATFSGDANIDLLGAYSPINNEAVISVQYPDPAAGFPSADLWLINLDSDSSPRQITNSPALLKTDAVWSGDGRTIYFIGSVYDDERQSLRGGIYSVLRNGSEPAILRYESEIFSPASILWRFD